MTEDDPKKKNKNTLEKASQGQVRGRYDGKQVNGGVGADLLCKMVHAPLDGSSVWHWFGSQHIARLFSWTPQPSRASNTAYGASPVPSTHFAIKGPSVDENIYVNRKRYHSMNVQVVCDAAKLIISFCARFPGVFTSGGALQYTPQGCKILHLVFCSQPRVRRKFQNLSRYS
ncbi:putative nuclease HARBI1 [Chionoecetes opilio]|uniref:Putative nuclease HARBI1 n=1 Tax=Chionoecetes opilio TaxID=41210 RepID=A0A8J4YCB2_CHIOP|nr:putative nuclease HARBI1 [Chionoecetes opilio]